MRWFFMPSSVIKSFDFRPRQGELEVLFTTGRRYLYFGVPQEVVDRLRSASSKGAFFNREIRPRFDYREIIDAA